MISAALVFYIIFGLIFTAVGASGLLTHYCTENEFHTKFTAITAIGVALLYQAGNGLSGIVG